MNSLLVKLASTAVMIHMTLGCHWHHGLGVQACEDQCPVSVCNHHEVEFGECDNGAHEHGDRDYDHPIGNQATNNNMCNNNSGHCHFGCQDDGCNATKLVKFEFWPAEFSLQYFCGAENAALVASQACAGNDIDPFPDCSHTETSVRAHLLLGVQLL
jgi:hypothetical protein